MLTEEQKEMYKQHPRVLEVRFALLYQIFEKEFGEIQARKILESICTAFSINYEIITHILNTRYDIRRDTSMRWKKWRQTVIFIGYLYDVTVFKLAEYLGVQPQTIYRQKEFYDVSSYLNDEWLGQLDDKVCLCKMSSYRMELQRFMDVADMFTNVAVKWERTGMK